MFDRDPSPVFAESLNGGYYSIYVVSFVVFLFVALMARLCFINWRSWFPGAEDHTSLLGGVRSAVYSFMDYLN